MQQLNGPDIVFFGEPLIEFTQVVDGNKPEHNVIGFGGDTLNTAVNAARLGARVGIISALGKDHFGDKILRFCKSEKIDISVVSRNPDAPTGIYIVEPHKENRNFSYYRFGSAASKIGIADLPNKYIKQAKILHTSGISQAISKSMRKAVINAIEYAKSNGVKVSYDSNLRLKLWPLDTARQHIHHAMSLADFAFPSIDDSQVLTGLERPDDIVDFYLQLGCRIVVLKMGKQGALTASQDFRQIIKAHPVKAVDSTGAGDAFAGAFLACLLKSDDLIEATHFAAGVAARTVSHYGALSATID